MKAVRHLDGYCEVSFPHCPCDSRKDGHVIAIVGKTCFKLQACKTDGSVEVGIGDVGWELIFLAFRKVRATYRENQIFAYVKTKAQISFAVTAQLICAFVFVTKIVQFLSLLNQKFQASCSFLRLYRLACVGPVAKTQILVILCCCMQLIAFMPLCLHWCRLFEMATNKSDKGNI